MIKNTHGYNQSVTADEQKSIVVALDTYATATTWAENTIAIASGLKSLATALKKNSLAISFGGGIKVKGVKGSWIMAIDFDDAKGMDMAVGRVDDINIKADTWYILKEGRLVEAGEE